MTWTVLHRLLSIQHKMRLRKWPREWCALTDYKRVGVAEATQARRMAGASLDLTTEHLYYGDTERFTCEGKVIAVEEVPLKDGSLSTALILDRTVMHPQGG